MRRRTRVIGAAIFFACIAVAGYLIINHRSAPKIHEPNEQTIGGVPRNRLAAAEVLFKDHMYTVVSIDLSQANMRLFWTRPDGRRFATFKALASDLKAGNQVLAFATNAGIFDVGFTPCGLHVEEGRQMVALNLKEGEGNFYMKPNGVFLINTAGAAIIKSTDYPGTSPDVHLATQSGPLLVIDGSINSMFMSQSTNRRIRSGVGVLSAQQVFFALSHEPVTFYEFASLFRDRVNCANALYLDGVISRFYLPPTTAAEADGAFAGILGVTAK